MTPDEKNMLADLAGKIAQTPAPPRDAEAEEFIRKNIGNRPDALYLMTQTVLIQNLALEQARQQIQQLQQEGPGIVPAGGSFLGGRQAPPQSQGGYGPQGGYPPPGYGPSPGYGPGPSYGPPPPQGGGSSFLRSAATTAAGVAGGMLAFQGVEALLGGLTHGFGGGGSGLFGGGAPGETIVENNYYDDPNRNSGYDPGDRFADDNSGMDASNFADNGMAPDDSTDYSDASFDDGSSSNDDLV